MSTDYNLYEDFQEKPLRKTLVDRLTDEIEKNLNNEQYSVDSLAQSVGMSRSSLHRKLKNILGISTSQFIREYRLKKAFIILKEEDITASEASYRVGFSSATYFSTSFHKFYGFTPGEVKSQLIYKEDTIRDSYTNEANNILLVDSENSSPYNSRKKNLQWIGFF